MGRPLREKSDFYPFHIYNRVNDQEFYPKNNIDFIWGIYEDNLSRIILDYNILIHGFVLMGNHYHLLMSTPQDNLDKAICSFQSLVSRKIISIHDSYKYRFETRYKSKIIKDLGYYSQVYRYIARNPVEAGLCKSIEKYPYSSFYKFSKIPICENFIFNTFVPKNKEERLSWLNTSNPTQ